MIGFVLRFIISVGLLLWAYDLLLPTFKEKELANDLTTIKQNNVLRVGTTSHNQSVFVGENPETGIEYELNKAFADYLGVKLNVIQFANNNELRQALNDHKIDLASAGLFYDEGKEFKFSPTYYSASWQVVYKKGTKRPYKIEELDKPLVVAKNSDVIAILQSLKPKYPNLEWQISENLTQEQILIEVAKGKIPYSVAPSVEVMATQHISPDLAEGFNLTDEMPIVWYLNKNSTYLQGAVVDFMGEANHSGLLEQIEEKYLSYFTSFNYVDMRSFLKAIETVLPKYKNFFEKYRGELSWQLLAATSYQESHWKPRAVSPTGVRGMMMLTLDTARRFGIKDRINAEQSIKGGAAYLNFLITKLPDSIPEDNKVWFALVAYNMGMGHLLDARALTAQLGGDPDNWLDVKNNLTLLSQKQHYSKLKYGYARGYEAFNYVENIRRYYNALLNYNRAKATSEATKTNTEKANPK